MTAARDYLRAGEIARLCGVSVRTVRRWMADGTLPSAKLGGARLAARDTIQQMLAPALPDWSKDDRENQDKIADCGDFGKQSPK